MRMDVEQSPALGSCRARYKVLICLAGNLSVGRRSSAKVQI